MALVPSYGLGAVTWPRHRHMITAVVRSRGIATWPQCRHMAAARLRGRDAFT